MAPHRSPEDPPAEASPPARLRRPLTQGRAKALPLVVAAGLAVSACTDASTGDGALSADGLPAASNTGVDSEADAGAGDPADGAPASDGERELPAPVVLDVPDPNSIYDPVRAGETLPEGFRQVLGRDAIAPVYDPSFVAAAGVDWPEDSLVIGVDLEGESRAYPVGFLNRREIVNDNHRGIPTLVTW